MKKLGLPTGIMASFSRRSRREKAVFFAAALFLSAAFLDRVVVASLSGKMKELDARIQARESEIRKDLRVIAQKQRIEIQHVKYKPYLGAMSTENEEFTVFLKEVDTLARENRVYVVDLKPTASKEMGEAKKYLVNLSLEAEMSELVSFMYALEDSRKLLTVEKYQISPKSKDSRTVKCSMIISKLIIP